jgi:hypothetical protein
MLSTNNFLFLILDTVILSFLKREHDRDFVNVSDRNIVQYECFRPSTVPYRSAFLAVPRS